MIHGILVVQEGGIKIGQSVFSDLMGKERVLSSLTAAIQGLSKKTFGGEIQKMEAEAGEKIVLIKTIEEPKSFILSLADSRTAFSEAFLRRVRKKIKKILKESKSLSGTVSSKTRKKVERTIEETYVESLLPKPTEILDLTSQIYLSLSLTENPEEIIRFREKIKDEAQVRKKKTNEARNITEESSREITTLINEVRGKGVKPLSPSFGGFESSKITSMRWQKKITKRLLKKYYEDSLDRSLTLSLLSLLLTHLGEGSLYLNSPSKYASVLLGFLSDIEKDVLLEMKEKGQNYWLFSSSIVLGSALLSPLIPLEQERKTFVRKTSRLVLNVLKWQLNKGKFNVSFLPQAFFLQKYAIKEIERPEQRAKECEKIVEQVFSNIELQPFVKGLLFQRLSEMYVALAERRQQVEYLEKAINLQKEAIQAWQESKVKKVSEMKRKLKKLYKKVDSFQEA